MYRAEVALVLQDPTTARQMLARAQRIELPAEARQRLAATLETAAEMAATIR